MMWWKVNGRAMTAETRGSDKDMERPVQGHVYGLQHQSRSTPPPRCSQSPVQPQFLAVALNNSRRCPDPAGLAHGPAPSVPYPPSEMPALSEAAGM